MRRGKELEASTKLKHTGITEIADTYLRTIASFHFVTGQQLTRRLYKMGMHTTVMARLKKLVDTGYLHVFWLPTVKSKSPNVYTLSAKGAKYLKEEAGLDVERVYKPSELAELSHTFLWHILDLNNFLIAAYLFEKEHPAYRIAAMQHDLTLKKKPIEIPAPPKGLPSGKPKTLIPDAFLDIRMTPGGGKRQRQYNFWVELDRGTETNIAGFKQKIRTLLQAIITQKAQEYFSVRQFSAIVFPTTAGEKRVEQMRKWTFDVLTEEKAPEEIMTLFLFTFMSPDVDPATLFLTPVWRTPLSSYPPVSLFGE